MQRFFQTIILGSMLATNLAYAGEAVLSLTTEPRDANVYIDGELRVNVTPVVIRLPAGPHRVRIDRSGYKAADLDLVLTEGVVAAPKIELTHLESCLAIKNADPSAQNGVYVIDPDGRDIAEAFRVYCDMTTNGGGWTIVYATDGGDNQQPMTGDTNISGNPLKFNPMNLDRLKKMAISEIGTEGLFVRNDGTWIKVNHALFDNGLATFNNHAHYGVTVTANDGASATGFIGYSNFNITNGGDYNVSMIDTSQGVDHHNQTYYHLNAGCVRQYLYSYSNTDADNDASYKVNTGIGAWTATATCISSEGAGIAFYAAIR